MMVSSNSGESNAEASARFAFEDFELDVEAGVLSRSRRPVTIRATPFRLLCCLVERRERIISKDELIDAVWDGAAVSDTAISSALKEVRKALGDSGKRPRFVHTKRRQGYRFVAPVSVRPPSIESHQGERPCVAVLPFDDFSSGADAYADGITEDLITFLSQVPGLLVVARSSTFAYKGAVPDIRVVGRELSADYVVEGSARLQGTRLRVTAQLVETDMGRHIWAEKYDRTREDVFALVDDVVEKIAAQLPAQVVRSEAARAARCIPESVDAWALYHQGVVSYQYSSQKPADMREAARLFDRALELAPDFPPALARRAVLFATAFVAGASRDLAASRRSALSMSRRAVELAPFDADVQQRRGAVLAMLDGPEAGIPHVARSLEIHPNNAYCRAFYGGMLARSGRYVEGADEIRQGIDLAPGDPRCWAWYSWLATTLFSSGATEAALEANERSLAKLPGSPMPLSLNIALLAKLGRMDEAQATAKQLLEAIPNVTADGIGRLWRAGGPKDESLHEELMGLIRLAGLE